MIFVNDSNIENIRNSISENDKPIILVFSSKWSFKDIRYTVEYLPTLFFEIEKELENCLFYGLDSEECITLSSEYNIVSFPTVIIFKNRTIVYRSDNITIPEIRNAVKNTL